MFAVVSPAMRACFSGQVPDSEPPPEGPGRQRGHVEPGNSDGWWRRAWPSVYRGSRVVAEALMGTGGK